MAASAFDVESIRAQFPALAQKQVYMDNAGGAQVPQSVISAVSDYLSNTNVQLGASYSLSVTSTKKFNDGYLAASKYINADPKDIVFGASTTQLFRNVSTALKVEPDSEFVLSKLDHEANIAAWLQLAKWKGITVKWWVPSKDTDTNPKLVPEDLKKLLSPKTKLVACTQTSNVLGNVTDVAALAKVIHDNNPDTLFAVDAVAYAPHAPIDVQAFGVDIYSFSWYKVYGPHVALLYVSERGQKTIDSLGHFFKPGDTLEEQLGLAGGNYEWVQTIPQIVSYIDQVGWDAIHSQEERLQEVLLAYLRSQPDKIQIYGEPSSDRNLRVPVISFKVKGWTSFGIIDAIEARSPYGCRAGHVFSKRLISEVLGIPDPDDGVVRCSLLHYNTVEEVEGLVKVLDEIIKGGGNNAG